MKVKVIGGGLAGSEAAWQLAQAGVEVDLWEMRPEQTTGAHHTGNFGELVCSNSLRSNDLENGVGLLKEELRHLNSLIMRCADETRIPAGNALAVDRHRFSEMITGLISGHHLINVHREEVTDIPAEGVVIIATGPLTSEPLSRAIRNLTGEEYLYFYDAAAPVVDGESIDMEKAFWGSRYGKGEGADYLNCPMNEEEYRIFWEALVSAEVVPLDADEKLNLFEGCLPVEEIARRGPDTLRFGPLKPVGLEDPRTGLRPWAVVQLRKEDAAGELFNLVGFQTRLRWGEQKRIFRMIPALEEAEFARLGVMHRNTYINSPGLLTPTYAFQARPGLFFAGQMTGVEGYVESAASGLVAGINAARLVAGQEPLVFPPTTMIGAMAHYISHREGENFQPMNANFGLVPPLAERIREKKGKKKIMAQRALNDLGNLLNCKNIVN